MEVAGKDLRILHLHKEDSVVSNKWQKVTN